MSHLCLRSALLQRGNALAAQGKEDESRESYMKVFPLLEKEPRCARVDWERHSLYVNIGNTYSRSGEYDLANEQYKIAERLGMDHLDMEGGSDKDGKGMVSCVKRSRAFALKRSGQDTEARKILKEVLDQEIADRLEAETKKAEEEAHYCKLCPFRRKTALTLMRTTRKMPPLPVLLILLPSSFYLSECHIFASVLLCCSVGMPLLHRAKRMNHENPT